MQILTKHASCKEAFEFVEHGCAPSCHTAGGVRKWGPTPYMANDKCLKASLDQLKRELLYSGDIWIQLDLGVDWRGDSTFASLGLASVVRAALASRALDFRSHNITAVRGRRASLPKTTP